MVRWKTATFAVGIFALGSLWLLGASAGILTTTRVSEIETLNGGSASAEERIFFRGFKFDPEICAVENGVVHCCGTKKNPCRGSKWLHPAFRPVALCIGQKLHLGGDANKCPSGIGESFRTLEVQKGARSLAPGWSLHNYGLAFDACCYFKSGDCSRSNLINVAVGEIVEWKKGGALRCQAVVRTKKAGLTSEKIAAMVTGNDNFPVVLEMVRSCFSQAGVPFGKWNWGIGWKDYFDAPHFQYFPSPQAGYYKGSKKGNDGAKFFLALLEDCYGGNRKKMLEDLFAFRTPESFLEKKAAGCGAKAYQMYLQYVAQIKTP